MRKIITINILLFLAHSSIAGITNDAYWKQLDYGWVCPADMELDFTNHTIFKASPEKAIYKEDIISLLLGLHERGLATQSGSNTYQVTPYSQSETFTELIYSTNGATVITNSITETNAIGYLLNFTPFLRQSYFPWGPHVPFDDNLGGMLGQYYDSSTIYDGMTNPAFWATRSNLFTHLNIGGVLSNGLPYLFTAVPGSTSVFTRYPVCYTQDVSGLAYAGFIQTNNYVVGGTSYHYYTYLRSTNHATNVQAYLSPYSQTVNYAVSLKDSVPYVATSYWYTSTQYVQISDLRLRFNYTNVFFNASRVYVQTNHPHFQRGEGSYWTWSDVYWLWYELGGGTEFEKYPYGNVWSQWPPFAGNLYPSAEGMWLEEEGWLGVRRQQVWRVILEERYKVLTELRSNKCPGTPERIVYFRGAEGFSTSSWEEAKQNAVSQYLTNSTETLEAGQYSAFYGYLDKKLKAYTVGSIYLPSNHPSFRAVIGNTRAKYQWGVKLTTNLTGQYSLFILSSNFPSGTDPAYDANGLPLAKNQYRIIESGDTPATWSTNLQSAWINGESTEGKIPEWCDEPTFIDSTKARGFIEKEVLMILDFDFKYCANKYW